MLQEHGHHACSRGGGELLGLRGEAQSQNRNTCYAAPVVRTIRARTRILRRNRQEKWSMRVDNEYIYRSEQSTIPSHEVEIRLRMKKTTSCASMPELTGTLGMFRFPCLSVLGVRRSLHPPTSNLQPPATSDLPPHISQGCPHGAHFEPYNRWPDLYLEQQLIILS